MNENNSSDIVLAEQAGNSLVLTPDSSKVFYYKDGDGNEQSLNVANLTHGTELFKDNANIGVDWEVDLPNLTSATEMFAGSQLHSFDATMPQLQNIPSFFQGCTNLVEADVTIKGVVSTSVYSPNNVNNAFTGCTNLTDVKLVIDYSAPIINAAFVNTFEGCSELTDVDIFFDMPVFRGAANMDFTNAFKDCTRLENINIHNNNISVRISSGTVEADGMFEGCLLGPEQLQQILDWGWYPRTGTAITIGVDSTRVTQTDIDTNWHGKFSAKNWNVTWQLNTPE